MKQKRNGFFTFIFSFMPGAVEMYMGFMKSGLSIMALFFGSIFISISCNLDSLLLFVALVWFFGFFHARSLAAHPAQAIQSLPDECVWTEFLEGKNIKVSNPTLRKWGAAVLIISGFSILWNNMRTVVYNLIPDSVWEDVYYIYDEIPQIVIAILIIIIGLRMILGKKEELRKDGE